jgi:hypothetical protein
MGGPSKALMPSGESGTVMQWKNYNEVETAFNRIVPGKTTLKDLEGLGFGPGSANVTLLDALTVKDMFLGSSGSRIEQYPKLIQDFLNDFQNCKGLQFRYDVSKTMGTGSWLLRTFDFKSKDHITGWNVDVRIFMGKNDIVVCTFWKASPNLSRNQEQKNPLGPIGPILKSAPGMAIGAVL